MKKIELTVEEVKNQVLPCKLSVALLPHDISAMTRNLNEFLSQKQSECSQVEWFKLSEKRPEDNQLILWKYADKHAPDVCVFYNDWGHSFQSKIYWTPCPTPPEFDSPCVKELKEYFKSTGATPQSSGIVAGAIEIVKRHEKKEEE